MTYEEKKALEQQQRDKKAADFHAKMHEVARHLGGYIYTPEADENDSMWYAGGELHHAGQVVRIRVILNLSYHAPTLRAEVAGIYATGPDGRTVSVREDAPRIGFLTTRPAAQLAGDLLRRFIPAYRTHAAQVREAADRAILYADKCEGARLLLNGAGFNFRPESAESVAYRANGRRVSGTLYGDVADLKIHSVAAHLVPRLLQLLDELTPGLTVAA